MSSAGLLQTVPNPNFDFETQNLYQAELSVSDYLYESTRQTLDIQIVDVNEKPIFGVTDYEATIDEALVSGE